MGGELVDKDIKTEGEGKISGVVSEKILVQVLLSNKDVDMIIRSTGSDILMIILINNGYSNILLSARK
ncbi:7497_t:CDS:2 [Rhizophagus irregularis]|nr:7497_t:CDS:2 [Rhizophagus irregularis]